MAIKLRASASTL